MTYREKCSRKFLRKGTLTGTTMSFDILTKVGKAKAVGLNIAGTGIREPGNCVGFGGVGTSKDRSEHLIKNQGMHEGEIRTMTGCGARTVVMGEPDYAGIAAGPAVGAIVEPAGRKYTSSMYAAPM